MQTHHLVSSVLAQVRRAKWRLTRGLLFNRIKRQVAGSGNRIEIGERSVVRTSARIFGNDNEIVIGGDCELWNLDIFIRGSSCSVQIGPRCHFSGRVEIHLEDDGTQVLIAEGTTIESAHLAATEPNSILSIGPDCMLATGVQVRTGDSHSILGPDGRRTNFAGDVTLRAHVWVGANAMVLKGVSLESGTVVAAGAIVTRSCDRPNVVLAGNPAKISRADVSWTRERLPRQKAS